MNKDIKSKDALQVAEESYIEYGLYVAQGRAYPSIYDGMKSSYKRSIYGMYVNGSRSIEKVAILASNALPYHPHPSSISGVVVSMGNDGNKFKLLDTQGTFGDTRYRVPPASDRYLAGRLSNLAIKLTCNAVEYTEMVEGEIGRDEPLALPTLLPLCFINGDRGIPSGLPTLNIPPLNIIGMIDYYIDILEHESLEYIPSKLPNPNIEIDIISSRSDWKHLLLTGKGSIKVAPIMSIKNGKITITQLPDSKTIDHIYKILSEELRLDKLDVRDESTDTLEVVIEKVPRKWCNMNEIFNRLYQKLQSSISYNMAFFDENHIYVPCGFDTVVKKNLEFLIKTHKSKLKREIEETTNRITVLDVIQKIRDNKDMNKMIKFNKEKAIEFISNKYKVSKEDAGKILQKPISYLTKSHDEELKDLQLKLDNINESDSNIYKYLLDIYKEIKSDMKSYTRGKYLPTKFIKQK